MRGKRSKQYRKLMQQYGLSYGFREPYQVLLDADIIRDADRMKMDLIGGLERTLHGQVKPMVTQCSMRHLYSTSRDPGGSFVIDKAKAFERRRCDHLPDEYPEPLCTKDCLAAVVDGKNNRTNKHRYVVATQDPDVRKHMRTIKGVPIIYINRSVMIMEPMAGGSMNDREKDERGKFREGIKRTTGELKRKRAVDDEAAAVDGDTAAAEAPKPKKKRRTGPKQPNPLSVKKAKPKKQTDHDTSAQREAKDVTMDPVQVAGNGNPAPHRKRRRRPVSAPDEPGEPSNVVDSGTTDT